MTAFYHLALDTGARRAELCGLLWQDIDLVKGQVSIVRQLIKPGAPPQLGPPKNGKPRTITLTPGTVDLLRQHKAQQAQIKLANGGHYQDFGLAFAKDWWGVRTHGQTLGHPLQSNAIGQGEFKRLIDQAGIKPIKFHGLGTPVPRCCYKQASRCMSSRSGSGHKRVEVTLGIYAHVLPAMQEDAASKLGTRSRHKKRNLRAGSNVLGE